MFIILYVEAIATRKKNDVHCHLHGGTHQLKKWDHDEFCSSKKMRQWRATHHHLVKAPTTPKKNFVEAAWAQKKERRCFCGSTNNKIKNKKWVKAYVETANEIL